MKTFLECTNPNISLRAEPNTRLILQQNMSGLNSLFSFLYTGCYIKVTNPSLLNLLPIEIGRILGFMPFPMALVRSEMKRD